MDTVYPNVHLRLRDFQEADQPRQVGSLETQPLRGLGLVTLGLAEGILNDRPLEMLYGIPKP